MYMYMYMCMYIYLSLSLYIYIYMYRVLASARRGPPFDRCFDARTLKVKPLRASHSLS